MLNSKGGTDSAEIQADDLAPVGSDLDVRRRLVEYVKRYGSTYKFQRQTGLPRSVIASWRRGEGSLPSFINLRKMAAHGLSLDWLMTGNGSPQRAAAQTELGMLINHLRPFLQREAKVGERTDDLAFATLAVKLGPEGILERAAGGLLTDYKHAVNDLVRTEETAKLTAFLADQLSRLESRLFEKDAEAVREILALARQGLEAFLPSPFRDHAEQENLLRQQVEIVFAQQREAREQGLHESFFADARMVLDAVRQTQWQLDQIYAETSSSNASTMAALKRLGETLNNFAESARVAGRRNQKKRRNKKA